MGKGGGRGGAYFLMKQVLKCTQSNYRCDVTVLTPPTLP